MLSRKVLHNWFYRKPGYRLPIEHAPMRVPGQSLEVEVDALRLDLLMTYLAWGGVSIVSIVACALLSIGKPQTIVLLNLVTCGIVLTGLAAWAIWNARRTQPKLRNYYLGLMAERVVGQQLERTRYINYSVFHDLLDENETFNIDHVAIGPGGIIVVETKGKSQPEGVKRCEIKWDGHRLTFPDGSWTVDPIKQVRRNAKDVAAWVRKSLSEEASPIMDPKRELPVVHIVVYPGWQIDFSKALGTGSDLKVTSDAQLVDQIKKLPDRWAEAEYKALGKVLGKRIQQQRKWLVDF